MPRRRVSACILRQMWLWLRGMTATLNELNPPGFAAPTTLNGVEVRLSNNGRYALVQWPWHLDYTDRVAPTMKAVRSMGFTDIIEQGAEFREAPGGHAVDYEYYLLAAA